MTKNAGKECSKLFKVEFKPKQKDLLIRPKKLLSDLHNLMSVFTFILKFYYYKVFIYNIICSLRIERSFLWFFHINVLLIKLEVDNPALSPK